MSLPRVSVVILNWNGWRDTVECLESIFRIDYPKYQVIVIDNGSTDDSIEKIKAWAEGRLDVRIEKNNLLYHLSYPPVPKPIPYIEYDREIAEIGGISEKEKELNDKLLAGFEYPMILIQAGANLGFARGNNVGIRYALTKDFTYIMLLNNDTVVTPSLLGQMVRFMEKNRDVGVSTPCIYYYWNQDEIWNCGGKLLPLGQRKYYTPKQICDRTSTYINVSFVTGCAPFVRSNVFKENGLLSEEFFFGEEDYEFSIRMRKNRVRMVCELDTRIYHKVGSSVKKLTGKKLNFAFIHHLNRLVHLKKYYRRHTWLIVRFFALLYFFSMLIIRYGINFRVGVVYAKKLIEYSSTLNEVDRETFDTILSEEFI